MSVQTTHTASFRPVVWITGASQGIGKSLALKMAARGTTVIASARNVENLKALEAQASGFLGNIYPLPLDVTDQFAVYEAVKKIVGQHGRIDQAILNAGNFIPMSGHKFKASIVEEQVQLNLMGVCYCLEPLIPLMREQGQGVIAINASLSGYRGLPTAAAYGATKAALINMAECLYFDLADSGVDIKIINPGFVKTPLTDKNTFPMPFLMPVEKAANIIIDGMNRKGFEIRFPLLFALVMRLLQLLPYSIYFKLIKHIT